ncbi:MAG: hypothetical protein HUJ91_02520, partial [Bacteroidales bacterium]|nr:hypothetical protein [Bacteroidales bacterium]
AAIAAVSVLSVFSACSADAPSSDRFAGHPEGWRLIHNNDGTDLLANLWFGRRPISVSDIEACVDMVAETPVSTYMMCTGSEFVYYRSEYATMLGDDRGGTRDCGTDSALFNSINRYYRNILKLEEEGTDVVRVALNRAKKRGMEAFVTYRMNDLHFNDVKRPHSLLCADFWNDHPEWWTMDASQGYLSDGALDFAVKEVREHKKSIIFEQLDRYEMLDGFELDFMRFSVYFKGDGGRNHLEEMTQMVREIKGHADSLGKLRGHPIMLAARVPITLEACLDKGLDIRQWLHEGLLDFITIGVHWTGDTALPVERFRKELGADLNIPLYATIDDGGFRPRELFSHGMILGAASHILGQGADGIYLFNYYLAEYNQLKMRGESLTVEPGGTTCRIRTPHLLSFLASPDSLEGRNKSYCLGHWQPQYKVKPITDLPIAVCPDSTAAGQIFVGDKKCGTAQEAILFFRTDSPVRPKIWFNSTEITRFGDDYPETYDRARGLNESERQFAVIVPANFIKHGLNTIEFRSESGSCRIIRLELSLRYGSVEECGYF